MKFIYEYRTSDNVRHDGVIMASDREAAFASLKKRGIRPGSIVEAPGFFNKLFGKGKRWIAIGVLGFALVVVVVDASVEIHEATLIEETMDSPLRRQIIGDQAVIEKGVRTGWSDVFQLDGDRFLASFAIPGVPSAVRSTTVEELEKALATSFAESSSRSASLESRQIIAIVSGMKKEIAGLLEDGWSIRDVGSALVKRQEREIAIYKRAAEEVERAHESCMSESDRIALWEKKNAELRNLGIKLIPMPE